MDKKLYRDEYRKKIAGVCAGLADYFNIDVAIVRVVFLLALIFHGGGGLIYIIFWIVLPKKPFVIDPGVDYRVPPQNPGSTTFGSGSFANTTASGSPFGTNPFPNQPYPPYVPKSNNTSLVAIIFGVILIVIGGSILLDDFDILPDWDFGQLWPIILILIGGALMISGETKKPWEKADWHKAEATDTTKAEEKAPEANPPADNAPTE